MKWIRDRALTLTLMTMFLLFLAGQLITGFAEFNSEQEQHGHVAVDMDAYLATATPGRRSSRTGKASSYRWRCSCC